MSRDALIKRIKEVTGWSYVDHVRIVTDVSDWMRIDAGDVVVLDGQEFLIKGNMYETRFGISEQPKYWVFSAVDLEGREEKIIKMPFHESFDVRIAGFRIHCFRSSEKEVRVLNMVRGDRRFMQGRTVMDSHGNPIRILDYIKGDTIFKIIHNNNKSHERYYHEDLPGILRNLTDCIHAIILLHDNHMCHGDIRNDHIIVDADGGYYRWIDFDLNQHVLDFDLWSMGNILNYAVGKGINAFSKVLKSDAFSDRIKNSLAPEDASAFYEYRVMNLKKLYPYISDRLSDILLHFTVKPKAFYPNLKLLLRDYIRMLERDFPMSGSASNPGRE
jgi:hypothetical protein